MSNQLSDFSQAAFINAHWEAPAGITAFTTTRFGGVSQSPYEQFNLGFHVGDAPDALAENISRLHAVVDRSVRLAWVQQVHGTQCVHAEQIDNYQTQADAVYTQQANLACAILTADCLPVVLCDKSGREIAAVHAGWKGLAAGIITHTVQQFEALPEQMIAWLGPAIGPLHFEVGEDVRLAFLTHFAVTVPRPLIEQCFSATANAGKYLADLYQLARLELFALGVKQVSGGGLCTFADQRFYSYRRDKVTGRMATVIVRNESH